MKQILNNIGWIVITISILLFSCNNINRDNSQKTINAVAINNTGLPIDSLFFKEKFNISIKYYNNYLDTATKINDLKLAKIIRNLGVCYSSLGKYDSAKLLLNQALVKFSSINCFLGIAKTHSNLCGTYLRTSELSKAIDNGMEGIQMIEDFESKEYNKDKLTKDFYLIKSAILTNIGVAYMYQLDRRQALKYYNDALSIAKQIGDSKRIDIFNKLIHNIANALANPKWSTSSDISKALIYYKSELQYAKKQCDCLSLSYAYYSIANIYSIKKYKYYSLDTTKMYLDYAFKILNDNFICDYKSSKCNVDILLYSSILRVYSDYYYNKNHLNTALQYVKQTVDISQKLSETSGLATSYSIMAKIFFKLKDYTNAYKYSYLNLKLEEKQNNEKTIKEFNTREQERTFNKNKILEAQNKLQQSQLHSKNLIIIEVVTIAVIIILGLMFFLRYRIKYVQHIKLLNNNLSAKNKDISDSISYANRIQQAILPPQSRIDELFHDNFIFHKPKDTISGDFYWTTNINQFKIFVVADCTGHGVPGALLSMLGISYLNEIVLKRKITQANEILNELRKQVIISLRQTKKSEEPKDGIDAAVCIINTQDNTMQYAGAYNPIYFITKTNNIVKLNEIKADRMPVGMQLEKDKSFTNNVFKINPGDVIYLFSDGFVDQFGGVGNKKFKSTKFKNLLLQNHKLPMIEQKEQLNKELEKWKGDNEQVDDILVVGIRV